MARSFVTLTLVFACLLCVCGAVPVTPADRTVDGFIPSAITAPRNNAAAVFVNQGNFRVSSVGRDGSLLFPSFDVETALSSGRIVGSLAADRTCTDGSRVWLQVTSCPSVNCSALWLLDLSTQSVLLSINLSTVALSPAVPYSQSGVALQLVDVDASGVALLTAFKSAYAVNIQSALQLSSFSVPDFSYADVDVSGNLWLLYEQGSNLLVLYGYSQQGEQLYMGKPDLSDVSQQLVAAIVVDAGAVLWIRLVNLRWVFSWNTSVNARGPSINTTVGGNYIGPILTAVNATCIAVASKEEGALQLLDTSQPSNPPTVVRSPVVALATPYDVVFSPTSQALLIRVATDSGMQIVAADPISGRQLYSFPIPNIGFRSNIAVDDSGLLYAQDYLGGPYGSFAVTQLDPVLGAQKQFPLNVYYAASAIAWDSVTQLLAVNQIGNSKAGSILFYTTTGEARGSISVNLPQGFVRSMAYFTLSGQRVLLQVIDAVYALNADGAVVATLSTPGFTPQDLVVDAVLGYTYVLGCNPYQCQVAEFNSTGAITEWLTPPASWTRQQSMLGVGMDGQGNVYASSTTYSALAVWTQPGSDSVKQQSQAPILERTAANILTLAE